MPRVMPRVVPCAALLASLVVLLCGPGAGDLEACPFCTWMGGRAPPVQTVLASSAVVAIARARPPYPDLSEYVAGTLEGRRWTTALEVVRVLKGERTVEVGALYRSELTAVPRADQRYLLTWDDEEVDHRPPRVRVATIAGVDVLASLLDLPSPEGRTPEETAQRRRARLVFFLPLLQHTDPLVAEAAYYEFTGAPYPEVKALKSAIDAEAVVAWLENEDTPYNRGLLFLLLGVGGGEAHRDRLRTWLGTPALHGPGLDGLLGAWLLMAGAEGLPDVERHLAGAADRRARIWFANCFVRALRFHEQEENVLSPTTILGAYRRLAANPRVAELGLEELRRLEDWVSLETVVLLWRDHGRSNAFIDAAARRYLQACPLPEAKSALERLGSRIGSGR